MRLSCPHCGERDRREFTYQGGSEVLDRPTREAGDQAWDDYLHNRDNPAADTQDMWYHDPCGAWIVADRNTVTHAITATRLASEVMK